MTPDNRQKTVPFCKDCKHHQFGADGHVCWKEFPTKDIVTGQSYQPQCSTIRADPDKCGWVARWHEPK